MPIHKRTITPGAVTGLVVQSQQEQTWVSRISTYVYCKDRAGRAQESCGAKVMSMHWPP